MVTTDEVVVGGSVGGTKVDDVGGGMVVVVSGGEVLVVVSAGGWVVLGAVVPLLPGAVVATGARVVAVVIGEPGMVVVLGPTVDDVEDEVDDSKEPTSVVVGRRVVVGPVVEDDWLATCCLGAVSLPVATSNRRAAKAIVARA
jgi:hypothetical protein